MPHVLIRQVQQLYQPKIELESRKTLLGKVSLFIRKTEELSLEQEKGGEIKRGAYLITRKSLNSLVKRGERL